MCCIILEIRQQVFYVSTHFISCKSQKKNRDMWRCILNGGSDYFPHVSIAAEWMETNPRQSRYFVSLWLVNCWFGIWYVIWRYWKFTFLLCVNKIKKLKSQWTWACRMPYWHQRILCWGFITNPPPPSSLSLLPGKGVVYHYDPVGHMEKLTFSAAGASVSLIQPFLDNQVGAFNMEGVDPPKMTKVRQSEKRSGVVCRCWWDIFPMWDLSAQTVKYFKWWKIA